MTQQRGSSSRTTREWQMQIKVWLHRIVLSETVFMSEVMQGQPCVAEDCCHLELKTTNSWNRHSELLPKHLSIAQSSHIPNVLCYRIPFSSICGGPPESSLNNLIWHDSRSPSPLSYFQHYLSPPTSALAKRSMALTSQQLQTFVPQTRGAT